MALGVRNVRFASFKYIRRIFLFRIYNFVLLIDIKFFIDFMMNLLTIKNGVFGK